MAVLVSVRDEDEVERLVLGYSPKFQALLRAARQEIDDGGGIGHEDLWQGVESEALSNHE